MFIIYVYIYSRTYPVKKNFKQTFGKKQNFNQQQPYITQNNRRTSNKTIKDNLKTNSIKQQKHQIHSCCFSEPGPRLSRASPRCTRWWAPSATWPLKCSPLCRRRRAASPTTSGWCLGRPGVVWLKWLVHDIQLRKLDCFYDFPFSWECHHPNWRTPSFFRGVGIPPARLLLTIINHILTIMLTIIEGSLEVKLPTIWTVEKQRWEESEEKRSEERRCRCAKR